MITHLPEDPVEILSGIMAAESIAKNLHSAFWLHSVQPSTSLFLVKQAHSDFAMLADALGYSVAQKPAAAPAGD